MLIWVTLLAKLIAKRALDTKEKYEKNVAHYQANNSQQTIINLPTIIHVTPTQFPKPFQPPAPSISPAILHPAQSAQMPFYPAKGNISTVPSIRPITQSENKFVRRKRHDFLLQNPLLDQFLPTNKFNFKTSNSKINNSVKISDFFSIVC